jgi:hypothetical protein
MGKISIITFWTLDAERLLLFHTTQIKSCNWIGPAYLKLEEKHFKQQPGKDNPKSSGNSTLCRVQTLMMQLFF